jgi:hypothetical protein
VIFECLRVQSKKILGGFDLHEDSGAIINRLLEILQQFLLSDQNIDLALDKSFKVYVNVLSVNHINFKKNFPRKKQSNKRKKKKHYGHSSKRLYNFGWAIDIPDGYKNNPKIFKNKCLFTTVILGHLQNEYYKSNRTDKRFLYAQNINSNFERKKIHAGNIIRKELLKLLEALQITNERNYEVDQLLPKLSEYFNCQIFIFDGINNSSKLKITYPKEYNNKLQPIYLFEPFQDENHLLFIRHLPSYFKSNVKVCFTCQRKFKTYNYKHLCSYKHYCFACRRPFSDSSTYLHEKLEINFCNGKIVNEPNFTCPICNVTLYSKACERGHKLICNGAGNFGWKCLKCNKFTYRQGNLNAKKICENHTCGYITCKNCKELYDSKENDHLCKMQIEKLPFKWPSLAFFCFEFLLYSSADCASCFEVKNEFKENYNLDWKDVYEHTLFANLKCEFHKFEDEINLTTLEPNVIIIYKEDISNKGQFYRHILTDINYSDSSEKMFDYDYCLHEMIVPQIRKTAKRSQDLLNNIKDLDSLCLEEIPAIKKFFKLICSDEWRSTTFIAQDEDSIIFVSSRT